MIHTPPSTYILRDLVDVAIPESVSWFPQTIGWKILAVIIGALMVWRAIHTVNRWWNNRYRDEARHAIEALDVDAGNVEQDIFSILKIVLRHTDKSKANYFGEQFLDALDLAYNGSNKGSQAISFHSPLGKHWLDSLVNRSIKLERSERKQLINMSLHWVRYHKLPSPSKAPLDEVVS